MKQHKRVCFMGSLHAGTLRTQGAKTTITDATGEYVRDYWEPNRVAWLNLGDRVIVSNANLAIDEVAGGEVVAVRSDGGAALRVQGVSEGKVHVHQIKRRAK